MGSSLNELALSIPCPKCGARAGAMCNGQIARETKRLHEARVAQVRAPASKHRLDVPTSYVAPATPVKTVANWFAAEWALIVMYLSIGVVAFGSIAALQHYWPTETLLIWDATWRPIVGISGAIVFVLLVFEFSLRGIEKRDGFEDADGNCTVCGVGLDEKCLPVRAVR